MKRLAIVAILGGFALTACAVPPGLNQFVNDGAAQHAAEHVAAGDPASEVLCASSNGDGYLVPSFLVTKWGGCHDALAHATSTECHWTGLPAPYDISCSVLGDDGTTPVLQGATGQPAGTTGTGGGTSPDAAQQTVIGLQTDPAGELAGRRVHDCITPSGWHFRYYEPIEGGPVPPRADCTRLTVPS